MRKIQSRNRSFLVLIFSIIAILLLLLLFEVLRATIYYSGIWRPKVPTCHGIEYYSSGSYLEFEGCQEASEYLPTLDELKESTYADFYYVDKTPVETAFGNGAIAVCVGFQYDECMYDKKKSNLLEKSRLRSYLDGHYTESRFFVKEKLSYTEYLYFFAACSDETHSIVYFVCIDNKNYHYSDLSSLCYAASLGTSAFWNNFFPPEKTTE